MALCEIVASLSGRRQQLIVGELPYPILRGPDSKGREAGTHGTAFPLASSSRCWNCVLLGPVKASGVKDPAQIDDTHPNGENSSNEQENEEDDPENRTARTDAALSNLGHGSQPPLGGGLNCGAYADLQKV